MAKYNLLKLTFFSRRQSMKSKIIPATEEDPIIIPMVDSEKPRSSIKRGKMNMRIPSNIAQNKIMNEMTYNMRCFVWYVFMCLTR
ncbi:MAG: hypothetical protein A2479_02120 [Candidatus Magasanikbacteria bacterium RIFOXYC2_FULL_39_8]|nr:MAG: hypothetical protein A2479_02120 [Candidatus Magasanikbacteria bacterium RIFOXYC2_FULL_39_8]